MFAVVLSVVPSPLPAGELCGSCGRADSETRACVAIQSATVAAMRRSWCDGATDLRIRHLPPFDYVAVSGISSSGIAVAAARRVQIRYETARVYPVRAASPNPRA
jgi:hypothetical protein